MERRELIRLVHIIAKTARQFPHIWLNFLATHLDGRGHAACAGGRRA